RSPPTTGDSARRGTYWPRCSPRSSRRCCRCTRGGLPSGGPASAVPEDPSRRDPLIVDRDEVHGLPEGPTLHRHDPVAHLQAETRWRVHVQPMSAFLVPFELLDVPEILSLHDDRVLHLCRDDDALEHLTANREPPVEGTLHVRADLARHGDVDPDVPPAGRGRRGRCRSLPGPSLLLRHR